MTTGVRSGQIGNNIGSLLLLPPYCKKKEHITELPKAMLEKMDANLKEIRAGQELLKEELLAKMETNQKKMAKLDSKL
jgi:hypothetical protein